MDTWFEELSTKRKKFDDSVRDNNFEEGIRHSTVEKYPDPVHFVYELLQNAEDQAASEARFQLTRSHLIFSHNGNPFTRQDVENITGIGNSNKPQEANKIGRFGIGFKSVFAITERPEIYTELEGRPFAFAIEHLVVPVAIPENLARSNQFKTQFIFPFIREQKHSLFIKIRERLSSLGLETLLFLKNLESVEWQAEADHGIYLREINGSCCELCGESEEDRQVRRSSENYLVFTRNIQLNDSDRDLDIRIAFRMNEEGRILSEERSPNLAVYFPTEQATGLHFRLHGPFLLTDNRANIKSDNATNYRLIQECAYLLAESIQKIKEQGLLTVDFLALLPIRKDIPAQFMPLYEHVLKQFRQHPLLPTEDGVFANSQQVRLARGAELRDLINGQQLSALYGTSFPLHWLPAEITQDKMPDLYSYLTKDLQVAVIYPITFVQMLEMPFLEQQTDEWLVKLYIFLSKQPSLRTTIKGKPILRLENNSHVTPFKRTSHEKNEMPNAYLLREGDSKFPLVKKTLLSDNAVFSFFKEIGLSAPDVVDEVLRFILPPYEAGEVAFDDEQRYQQDLQIIQKALKNTVHRSKQELITKLNETSFLQAFNAKTAIRAWKAPCEVYRKTRELSIWFEGNKDIWFVMDTLPESLCRDLKIRDHLKPKAREVMDSTGYVIIRDWYGDHQRGLHRFDPAASLDGLQYALEHITPDKARILWDILLEHLHLIKGIVETSTQQNFSNSQKKEKYSPMGSLCIKNAWLPDKEGRLCLPRELFLTNLAEDFENDTHEAQELALKLGMRRAEEIQLADKLGIPHEIIPFIQHDPNAILAWYKQQQKKPSLPSSIANDPVRRQEKAAIAAYITEVKAYKAISINKRISARRSEPRTYLRSHNTNEEGQLICQLCDSPMPFRIPNGEEYFEAYQYIDLLDKEYDANHLALCPNCAAELQHACQTDESKRAELILDMDIMTEEKNLVLYLDMPVHKRLRFTQRHLIDLQIALKDWLESESNMEAIPQGNVSE